MADLVVQCGGEEGLCQLVAPDLPALPVQGTQHTIHTHHIQPDSRCMSSEWNIIIRIIDTCINYSRGTLHRLNNTLH